MKGLILAGGAGTRLRPLTHTGAKQLVPVANKPILFYVIENLVAAGVTEICIILSPETGKEIMRAVGANRSNPFGAQITYITQERPAGLAHAVLAAHDFLGESDFVMYLGDNLVEMGGDGLREMITAFEADTELAASLLLKQVKNPFSFGVAEVDGEGNVLSLVEKPSEPKSDLALVGIYLFSEAIFDAIEAIEPSLRGELEITDAISRLISWGQPVKFTRLDGWWLDTGKKDDLLLANDTVLDKWCTSDCKGHVDEGSQITGRVQISEGARVVRSKIRGPAVIGKDVVIIDSHIGPFTSLGEGVIVRRSSIEHSVLMEDCQVTDVHHLEDAILGKRVVVRPNGQRFRILSLMVGDDSVIETPSTT